MFLILALLIGVAGGLAQPAPADLVVHNARIYTGELSSAGRLEVTDALAVRAGKIVALGPDALRRQGPASAVIDARGATVVPGLIDSHGHMRGLGESLESVDLRDTRTVEEALERVRRAAAGRPVTEWILGRAWDQTRWPGGEFPTADALSRAAPEHPVYLTRVDGHAAWVNRKALELADIQRATPDPPGGRILRDAAGRPTGVLIDRAMGLVRRRIPAPSRQQVRNYLERAARACVRLGLTGVHDAGIGEMEWEAYQELDRAGRLPLRIYAMIGGEGTLWRRFLKSGPVRGDRLTVRSIKLMADGALGSRGAAMIEPYTDEPGNCGLAILDRDGVERIARQALDAGFQVNTHAIGDRANRDVVAAYAAVLGGPNGKRFRVEHAQVVQPSDFDRFRQFSIIASMQATHATSDMRWAEQRVGPRIEGAYAWQGFLKRGVVVANGSDFPVEDPNPLWGYYASVTRQDHAGQPPGGWRAQERMSRSEALRSWTWAGAFAEFEEGRKGTITTGKWADFVMLDRDIVEVPAPELLGARVLMTIVGGAAVHDPDGRLKPAKP